MLGNESLSGPEQSAFVCCDQPPRDVRGVAAHGGCVLITDEAVTRHGGVSARSGLAGNREFLGLLAASSASTLGDQLARIALAVLIYDRNGSALLAAATIAATYLPWIVAAPFLAGLGDRFERRTVLALSDLFRCLVAASLALPGLQTSIVIILVFVLTCADPPFTSAKAALLTDVLDETSYAAGQATSLAVSHTFDFLGYAVAGVTVAAVGPRHTMLIDAGTFAFSAGIIRLLLRRRGRPALPEEAQGETRGGWSLVIGNHAARWAIAMGATLIALDSVQIGIAVPWARQLGYGPALAGMLVAAGVIGAAVGQLLLVQLSPQTRSRMVIPLSLLTFLGLTAMLGVRTPLASALLVFVSGCFSCFQLVINQLFVMAMPPDARARAFGVAGTLINVGQGAAILLGGLLADSVLPSTVVGGAGVLGVLLILVLALLRPDSTKGRQAPTATGDVEPHG